MKWRPIVKRFATKFNKEMDSIRESEELCCEVDSLAIDAQDTTTGVTSFENEACECIDVLGKHFVPTPGLTTTPALQDLKEYFRRPVNISSGTVATALRDQLSNWNVNWATIFNT